MNSLEKEKREQEILESFFAESDHLESLHPQPHTVSIKDAIKFGNLEYERGVKDGIQSEKNRHWKPSKEQMDALNYFIKLWGNSDDQLEYTKIFNTVKSLRDDLEKQM